MLRQKLLLFFGSVVALLLAAGVPILLLLQSVLTDIESVRSWLMVDASSAVALQVRLGDVREELQRATALGIDPDQEQLMSYLTEIHKGLDTLCSLPDAEEAASEQYAQLLTCIDRVTVGIHDQASLESMVGDSQEALNQLLVLRATNRSAAEAKQRAIVTRLRWIVLALGLAFVAITNGSIIVLARMSAMILKPVDRLVDASRRLAREEFDHRVAMDRRDEFGELALAYNSLAAQLQANEERKIDTLHHVARTLNHELNNAIAIIQLQLSLASRSSGPDALQSGRLREIQQALSRMTGTVMALTRVRRIVLTDYLSGVKMLDLEASIADEPATAAKADHVSYTSA